MKRKLAYLLVICNIVWITTNPVLIPKDKNSNPPSITILSHHGDGGEL